LIGTFLEEGWIIGLVGEEAAVSIVKNNFHNMRPGLVSDDITRGIGLGQPQQMWISQN